MKKLLNKISTSLLYSMLFAAFFMGIGTLLSMAFFGMNFSQKLLSAHTISEKWRQGTAFYLSAMLVQFVILLISKHRKLLNSGYRLMVMGGISGMVMLPIALVMGYLLSGPMVSFETIFVVLSLPLFLDAFLLIPITLALLTGIFSGLLVYSYHKKFYIADTTAFLNLPTSEVAP
jgi:hypothetical protein